MKYLLFLCEGLSDRPVAAMDGKTPLSAAEKPVLDRLASEGETGLIRLSDSFDYPEAIKADMTLLGYQHFETGHIDTALEAIAAGIDFDNDDVIFRCTPVFFSDDDEFEEKTMSEFSGSLSDTETERIISLLNEYVGNDIFRFYSGKDRDFFMVWKKGEPDPGILVSPKSVYGNRIGEYLPKGDFTPVLIEIMKKACEALSSESGLNGIWLWGECKKPVTETFTDKYSLKGTMISAHTSMQGLGIFIGMDNVCNEADADTVISCFDNGSDLVCVHYSLISDGAAADEEKDVSDISCHFNKKVGFLESFDKDVLTPIISELTNRGEDHTIVFVSTVSFPCELFCNTSEAVPYMIYRSNSEKDAGSICFDEKNAFSADVYHPFGYDFINKELLH